MKKHGIRMNKSSGWGRFIKQLQSDKANLGDLKQILHMTSQVSNAS